MGLSSYILQKRKDPLIKLPNLLSSLQYKLYLLLFTDCKKCHFLCTVTLLLHCIVVCVYTCFHKRLLSRTDSPSSLFWNRFSPPPPPFLLPKNAAALPLSLTRSLSRETPKRKLFFKEDFWRRFTNGGTC